MPPESGIIHDRLYLDTPFLYNLIGHQDQYVFTVEISNMESGHAT